MMIKAVPAVKFAIIDEMIKRDNNLLNIKWLCEIAGVSRSGYYRWVATEKVRAIKDECDKRDFDIVLEAYAHRGCDKGVRGIYI